MSAWPNEKQIEAEMRYGRGEAQRDPNLTRADNVMRQQMKGFVDEVNRVSEQRDEQGRIIKEGRLSYADPNYVKGMYLHYDGTVGFVVGNKPLEGPKGFLKAKTFHNVEEAQRLPLVSGPAGNYYQKNLLAMNEMGNTFLPTTSFNMNRSHGGARLAAGRFPRARRGLSRVATRCSKSSIRTRWKSNRRSTFARPSNCTPWPTNLASRGSESPTFATCRHGQGRRDHNTTHIARAGVCARIRPCCR